MQLIGFYFKFVSSPQLMWFYESQKELFETFQVSYEKILMNRDWVLFVLP